MKKTMLLVLCSVLLWTGCNLNGTNDDEVSQGISLGEPAIMSGGDLLPTNVVNGVEPCGDPSVFDLFGGQFYDGGSITVYNDSQNVYVTFTADVALHEAHLWLGTDPGLLPRSGGGAPVPGQFPYGTHHDPGFTPSVTEYTIAVPIEEINFLVECGQSVFIYAHASIDVESGGDGSVSTETAWGGNQVDTGSNRWAYFGEYVLQCCTNQEPEYNGSETAFAKGNYVFTTGPKSNPESLLTLGLTKNRWGWANNLTQYGVYTYDLWAGAGLNDTTGAKLAGSVTISYLSNDRVTVEYSANAGFVITETHVYAADVQPEKHAPGQYGNTDYFQPATGNYAVTVSDVVDTNGDGIWIIAHAVVNFHTTEN